MDHDIFEIKYHLNNEGRSMPVAIRTDKKHFSTPSPRFMISVTISDIHRAINLEFEFPATTRMISRKPYELTVKDFECLKYYFIAQEEIEDYAPHHGYSVKAVMGCIHSFLGHIESEMERHYAQQAYTDRQQSGPSTP